MNVHDVIALARAGYTAEQITAFVNMASAQPQQMPQQMPQQNVDPVLSQLRALTAAVQTGNILNSNQPKQQDSGDIIAAIINPPSGNNQNGGSK